MPEFPWISDYVDLDSEIIPDTEMDPLYEEFPDLPRSPYHGCPTCDGKREYKWKGGVQECDCLHQLQLHKHYLRAGIGDLYQRLTWDDYEGDGAARQNAVEYLAAHRDMVHTGIGVTFSGTWGAGKTMLVCQIGKELVKLGYDVFFCTFQGMVQMFTKGWSSNHDRMQFERRVVQSKVFILDDVGKEFHTKNNLEESLFDHVLRQRAINARPTLITTNEAEDQLGQGYGGAILSLLKERSVAYEFRDSNDFRPRARIRAVTEAMDHLRRPIV